MKFTENDYQSLKEAVVNTGVDIRESRYHYITEGIGDNSEVRFLWDLFWAAKWHKNNRVASDKYLDSHIETAMKKIVAELI